MKKTKQQKANEIERQQVERILSDPKNFDPLYMDQNVSRFQLWNWNGGMLTAQLTRDEVVAGLKDKTYFIISKTAVGNRPHYF